MSFPAPLGAAAGTLVLLDVLRLGRGDADTLAMEPLLADITADPELTVSIALPTGPTQVRLVLLCILTATVLLFFWVGWLHRLTVRIGLFGWLQEMQDKRARGCINSIRCNAYGMLHIYLLLSHTDTQKIFTYFRVRFAAFAAAVGGFRLLFSSPRHNFINSGQVINHGEEPSPEIQMPPMDYHFISFFSPITTPCVPNYRLFWPF